MNFDTLLDPTSIAIFGARPEKDRVGYASSKICYAENSRPLPYHR